MQRPEHCPLSGETGSASFEEFRSCPTRESIPEMSDFLDLQIEKYEIPMAVGAKLHIVADEIYSNIVHYSGAKEAVVSLHNGEDTVTLLFTDDGIPYDPLSAREPDVTAPAQDREVGGLGLFMVKKMTQSLEYAFCEGKNRLTLSLSKISQKRKPGKEAARE